MMPDLAALVRVTSRSGAVWRQCPSCAGWAPLAADETHCPTRRPAAPRRRRAA